MCDHPARAPELHTLGMRLIDKHHTAVSTDAINSAIESLREAVDLTPLETPTRGFRLSSLPRAYELRFERTATMADINRAIQLCRQAISMTPTGHSSRGVRLKDLGNAYRLKYHRSGEIGGIDEAVQLYREGLDLKLLNDIVRVTLVHSLGLAYQARYQETATLADLNNSNQLFQDACDSTADTDAHKILAAKTSLLDTRTISLFQEAIDSSPAGGSALATHYADFGVAYRARERNAGEIQDLETAIQLLRGAVDLTGPNDPAYTSMLEELGMAICNEPLTHHEGFSTRNTASVAVPGRSGQVQGNKSNSRHRPKHPVHGKSIDKTLPRDLPRGTRLFELGSLHGVKYGVTGSVEDLSTGVKLLRGVVHGDSFDPYTKLMADGPRAYDTARSLIELIPLLIPRFLEASDAQYVLSDITGVACDAAAMALHAGKEPLVALEIDEAGRDVMAASIEDLRVEVSNLNDKYPGMAEQFLTQRDAPEKPVTGDANSSRRYEKGNLFGELIDKIRQVPGFEDFLRAPSEESLRSAASEHPIIVINVSHYRCDAIIVLHDCIRSIALPDLSLEKLQKQPRDRDALSDLGLLSWLWEVAMKPILDSLGFTEMPATDENWPRVSWIPTGLLSGFPLHAASYHGDASSGAVIDRVMSSYSSSIKAIINGRRTNTKMSRSQYVEQPPRVHVNRSCEREARGARRKQDIVSQLPDCNIFHFAGHGFTDSGDPSRSHLLLEDNGQSDPLEVATLLSMNLRKRPPFLAYISACGTGQVKNGTIFGESIHLMSAFRLAGFRHVIGTLWEVNDEYCINMARITYEGMRNGGMTDDSVCRGLHKASRTLRNRCLSMPRLTRRLGESRNDEVRSARGAAGSRDQRASKRNVLFCDDNERAPLHWVPYVHFGV
ncbi:CHAT domain-containing protein [Dactylonectria estremocensis]|uniref:CHAT domain-containing protein n=1 Tax=Dactylonectria estremocensis TaxID=1079267 RepID=A0A9P9DXC2_9HYPO|nr:CHAT domain-containing protein [Dactylonectria estremocensis]